MIYEVKPWTPKPISNELLQAQLVAAGIPCTGVNTLFDAGVTRSLSLVLPAPPNAGQVTTINNTVAAHSGNLQSENAAVEATVTQNEARIRLAAVSTIIAALEAGTATNNQIQNVLAKVLRYIRRETVS